MRNVAIATKLPKERALSISVHGLDFASRFVAYVLLVAEKLCVVDCIGDCIRRAIPRLTETERIGDHINIAFVFTRAYSVFVRDG
jgi:hypothetical protein